MPVYGHALHGLIFVVDGSGYHNKSAYVAGVLMPCMHMCTYDSDKQCMTLFLPSIVLNILGSSSTLCTPCMDNSNGTITMEQYHARLRLIHTCIFINNTKRYYKNGTRDNIDTCRLAPKGGKDVIFSCSTPSCRTLSVTYIGNGIKAITICILLY